MNTETNGITVTGEGSATAAPDIAKLALGVSVLRNTVAEARESASQSLQRIAQALEVAGVQDNDVQTHHISVSPEFDYDKGKQRTRGFRATNTIAITVRDLDRASEIIDAALAAGGDAAILHGIDFPRQTGTPENCRHTAVADPRAAETLATAGVSPAPVRIVESEIAPMPRR
jgi:uncharacterized protein YggE